MRSCQKETGVGRDRMPKRVCGNGLNVDAKLRGEEVVGMKAIRARRAVCG